MRTYTILLAISALSLPIAGSAISAAGSTPTVQWEVVHSPGGRPAALVASAFTTADDAWAVGSTGASLNGTGVDTLIEHWDGARWRVVTSLATPQSDEVLTSVVATSADDAWAVGWQDPYGTERVHALFMHWNGAAWTKANGAPGAGIARAVDATSPNDVWAVGLGVTEHFDGTSWSQVAPARADADLDAVTALAADDVWAVGSRPIRRGGYHHGKPYAAHWDGTRWSSVQLPRLVGTGTLASVSAAGRADVWAVGSIGGFPATPYVLHFDGERWRQVEVPAASDGSALSGVAAVSHDDVWAVGSQDGRLRNGFAVLRTFTEHFDGRAWSVVQSRDDSRHDNSLAAVAAADRAVWAFGGDGGTLVERRTVPNPGS